MELEFGAPRMDSSLHATGEEQGIPPSTNSQYDVAGLNLQRSSTTEVTVRKGGVRSWNTREKWILGTWNVRSMSQGKLDIVKHEMLRTGVSLLGVSELKWTGIGHFSSGDFEIYFSGHENVK